MTARMSCPVARPIALALLLLALSSVLFCADVPRGTPREMLEKKVTERDDLLRTMESLNRQRTILCAYDVLALLGVLWLGRRMLGGKAREEIIASSPPMQDDTVDTQASPFDDDKEPTVVGPKTGRASITVRDGSTQRVVTSGDVATRRVVKRISSTSGDRSGDTSATINKAELSEAAPPAEPTITSRRTKSASFTQPPLDEGPVIVPPKTETIRKTERKEKP
jgi:hypothetical protein